MVNKSRRDQMRNEIIRKMVGTTSVKDYVENHRANFSGHLICMKPEEQAAGENNSKIPGYKALGWARKKWKTH